MKAALIIDMPDSCYTCPVRNHGMCRGGSCPLHAMPCKVSTPTYRNYEQYHSAACYTAGWNECLERLEKAGLVRQKKPLP